MQYKRIVRHFAAFRRAIAHINAQRPAKNDVAREEPALAAVDVRSSTPGCPDGPPAMSISQRMGTIYPGGRACSIVRIDTDTSDPVAPTHPASSLIAAARWRPYPCPLLPTGDSYHGEVQGHPEARYTQKTHARLLQHTAPNAALRRHTRLAETRRRHRRVPEVPHLNQERTTDASILNRTHRRRSMST